MLLAALAFPVLIGIMGLGIDVSYWAMTRVELQRMADVAAQAGVARYGATNVASDALTVAATVAELNGLPAGTRGGDGATTLTDSYGPYAATVTFAAPSTVTVSVTQAVPRMFTGFFLPTATQSISATAVARLAQRTNGGQACILALNNAGFSTIINGSASIQMPGCDMRANGSILVNGQSDINVANIVTSGSITQNGNGICGSVTCLQGTAQMPDPYASLYGTQLTVPSRTVSLANGQTTLNPPPAGMAYSSFSLSGGPYIFNPGVYYISGDFNVNGNVSLAGTGVTFITNGNININGSADVSLSAPASGATAGLLFGSKSSAYQLNGGSSVHLTGAIYMPNANLLVNGGNSATGTCLLIVAANVTFNGGGNFTDTNCQAEGMQPIYDLPGVARLVQ
ncbi:pilus assembly protein TadG-related protein [Gluconacetobacter tumulisoli]|nr:pilus assembly protein TadG-related protein [Gluconacetobacter tumulisoli]